MTLEAVLGGKGLAALRVRAEVRIARAVHLGMLHQVVLPTEGLAALGPLARVPQSRVNVAVSLEVLPLAEALAAVVPLAEEGLLGDEAALTARLTATSARVVPFAALLAAPP